MQNKPRSEKAEQEFLLWQTWKKSPTKDNLAPLMESLQPVIQRKVNEFRTAPVPPGAVLGMANSAALRALNTYDPNKGANVRTYVDWHLKKVRSFVIKHQNVGRIPDHRAYRIGEFKTAKAELTEKLGHPPDAVTLSEHLGPKWSVAEVTRMEHEDRPDLIESRNVVPDLLPEISTAQEHDVLRYIYQELSPDERLVFEYSLGMNGKPQISAGEIAKIMNISQPKVSRIRKKIDAKIRTRGV